ncbi:MAG: TonB family protein [Bacteroidales bacterium]|jgi:protein TonB|nr:TonB family protein [Bacteroidales bacterium]
MKTKKSQKANLENKRGLFLQIGTVLVLVAVLAAFEWRVKVSEPPELIIRATDEPIELAIPITRPEQEQKEKAKPVAIIEPIIVPDNQVIIDEPDFISMDDNPDYVAPVFIEPEEVPDEPETDVDIKPKFMGKDDKAFREWIISKIRFPDQAVENNLAGVVKVKFIVGTDGKLSNIEIVRSVHPIIDKEVLRVIGNSPEWEPGFKNGKYVRTWYSISISFKFEN